MVGVTTQYFINMEIERWTLATGESAITGFCRLWKGWAAVFLACNVLPWMWPGWAAGAATMLTWEIGGDDTARTTFSILSLLAIGAALTLGPVVYNTVERLQKLLVAFIFLFMLVLFFLVVDLVHVGEMARGIANVGHIPDGMELPLLLGALAFAGAGGTMNLAQGNYVREKGYAMGRFAGRLTSPVTGRAEAVAGIGAHFEHRADNLRRWKDWWRAANREHLLNFYLLSVLSLMMLSLIAFRHHPGGSRTGEGLRLHPRRGAVHRRPLRSLDAARLSLDGDRHPADHGTGSPRRVRPHLHGHHQGQLAARQRGLDRQRLYFVLLWGQILLGCAILLAGVAVPGLTQPLVLLVLSASLNGGVMLIYSLLLLWMNSRVLGGSLRTPVLRFLAMVWASAFFGYFTVITLGNELPKLFGAE